MLVNFRLRFVYAYHPHSLTWILKTLRKIEPFWQRAKKVKQKRQKIVCEQKLVFQNFFEIWYSHFPTYEQIRLTNVSLERNSLVSQETIEIVYFSKRFKDLMEFNKLLLIKRFNFNVGTRN